MDAIEGWNGRVKVGTFDLSMDSWKVNATATKVAANDFESRMRKNKAGLRGAAVEFSGYHDNDESPFLPATPAPGGPGLLVGETYDCEAYLIKGSTLVFTFDSLTVFEIEESDAVDDRVNLMIRGETNGVFYYPGGIDADTGAITVLPLAADRAKPKKHAGAGAKRSGQAHAGKE